MLSLASFFDALFGVNKRQNLVPAINCPTSANKPSIKEK